METLLVLVENAGRVLTKEEIISAVWAGRVVDEANLAQNIAVVRKALNAQRGTPAHIETFPGRGYRLEGPVVLAQPAVVAVVEAPPAAVVEEHTSAPVAPVHVPEAVPVPLSEPAAPTNTHTRRPVWLWLAGTAGLLGALVAMWLIGRRERETTPEYRVSPLVRLTGKEYQPALSPDGSKAAFVWTDDGDREPSVFVKLIGEGSVAAAGREGGASMSPAWAPDGQSIAFLHTGRTETEIVVRSLEGSGSLRTVARLTPPVYGPDYRMLDWSPDGKTLVVSHALSLYLVDVASGEMRQITTSADDLGHVDPRFSPDGRTVSFIRLVHRLVQEIWQVPAAGGAASQLVGGGKRITAHDWVSDGRSIVFASDRTGEFRLWRQRLGASGEARREPGATGLYSEFPIQFAIARKSPTLAYSALHQDRNLWRLDLQSLTWKRTVASSGQDASPVYSPDGSRICFRSDRSGEEHLWVAAADGSNPVQITSGAVRPSVGRWAPDGRSIVFNDPRSGEIFLVREEASGWKLTPTGMKGTHPVMSPDARWIYAGGQNRVYRFPVTGGPADVLLPSRGEALAISADGRDLYFMREPNSTALWKIGTEDRVLTRVLEGIVPACTSCWSLAGNGIYFLGGDKQSFDRQVLYFHDSRTVRERVVTPYPEPLWPFGSGPFSLSPDGKSLLCVRVEPSDSDVMIVTPFR